MGSGWEQTFWFFDLFFNYFQNHSARMIFSKMVSNFTVLEGIFETKFLGCFFFDPNNFERDFIWKTKGEFNFLVNFFFVPINF